MKFLIPSYHRSEKQKTLEYLTRLGYIRDEIFIGVQTEADRDSYTASYGDKARIVYAPAHNAAGNRNTLLKLLKVGERAVMLDDDISSVDRLVCLTDSKHPFGRFSPIKTREAMDELVHNGFRQCKRTGGVTFGTYLVHNERMMYGAIKGHGIFSYDRLFPFGFVGLIFTGRLLNEQYDTKEDYEYILHQLRSGRPILRMNNVALKADAFSKGGCQEAWESDKNFISACMLVAKYPEYVKHNPRKHGEVLQINRRATE